MTETPLELQLFVVSGQATSEQARSNLQKVLRRLGLGPEVLEIVDVLERPDLAWAEKVLATPALLRRSPAPPIRLVGTLDDLELVTRVLDRGDAG